MIVDTSAAIAIMRGEPEAQKFLRSIERADKLRMSAASVLELTMVTAKENPDAVDNFIAETGIEVLPVDLDQLFWARYAFTHYGRGSGSPAKLNYGDCFAYAAARALREPLLFKGNDFTHTDVFLPDFSSE
ncbi:MAG: type II toxin-antitoxin system VapC family toxin [Microbacteriaceae bacterium]|nr:type II toxin-antitoxin system VapC family toxin [Microbacteriaceae bacterium]